MVRLFVPCDSWRKCFGRGAQSVNIFADWEGGEMDLNLIRSTLEAAGAEIELLEAGGSRALVVRLLPRQAKLESASAGDCLWIAEGDVAPLLASGKTVACVRL